MKGARRLAWLSYLLFLTAACSSSTVSNKVDYPITSIYSGLDKAMSMGIQRYSENRRTAYSRPFLIKQDEQAKKHNLHERGVAKVTILGEERPYTLEVEVAVERAKVKGSKKDLTDEDYEFERHDERLAKKLLNSILNILDKREHDQNIIDDFQAF